VACGTNRLSRAYFGEILFPRPGQVWRKVV
jgi:hypothetical protein